MKTSGLYIRLLCRLHIKSSVDDGLIRHTILFTLYLLYLEKKYYNYTFISLIFVQGWKPCGAPILTTLLINMYFRGFVLLSYSLLLRIRSIKPIVSMMLRLNWDAVVSVNRLLRLRSCSLLWAVTHTCNAIANSTFLSADVTPAALGYVVHGCCEHTRALYSQVRWQI